MRRRRKSLYIEAVDRYSVDSRFRMLDLHVVESSIRSCLNWCSHLLHGSWMKVRGKNASRSVSLDRNESDREKILQYDLGIEIIQHDSIRLDIEIDGEIEEKTFDLVRRLGIDIKIISPDFDLHLTAAVSIIELQP